MATNNIIQSIDYTSKDFYSLKNDLISRVQTRVNANGKTWTADDPADFGVAIVEAFAHVGDITNYYIDRVANETYLSTATQRQSLLNLAAMYGYSVSGYQQASVDVTFSNSSADPIVVPANTVFSVSLVVNTNGSSTTFQEYFTLEDELSIDGSSTADATLVHGRNVVTLESNAASVSDVYDIPGELLGYSTGYGNQVFQLQYNQVVDGSVQVFVRNGDQYVEWTQVSNLSEYGPQDHVYSLSVDGDNYVYVNFGDSISGAVPVYGDAIKATYYNGGGLRGNIDGGNTFSVYHVPVTSDFTKADLVAALTVTNTNAAFGGEDPEANEDIRRNAPNAFRSADRAVSLADFKYLALSAPGVGKAQSYASSPSSVALYIGPTVSDFSSDYFPGKNSSNTAVTTAWSALQTNVVNFMNNKTQIGTTVTVLPPTYVPVRISVEYVKEDDYSDAQIISQIKTGIVFNYGYNYTDFNQNLRPEKLEHSLGQIDGVETVKVLTMYRDGASSARTTLIPAQGELFVFQDTKTTIYPIASLANLIVTIGNGTMPAFSTLTKSYAFTSTSTTFTVTATAANVLNGLAAVLTYSYTNGSGTTITGTLTSGSASSSLTLTTGLNTVAITVTSADGLNTNTYYIKITK